MKIGIFDSGLGGLAALHKLAQSLPKFDYLYLGDTKNLPYGNKPKKEIYRLAVKAIEYLFRQNCQLVIVACNTVSSEALRKLQREYLPKSKFRDRRILGIIRPTVEAVDPKIRRVGIIGTNHTIGSNAYLREFKKDHPRLKIFQKKTPLLVPMIESQNFRHLDEVLSHYLKPFKDQNIQALILACTHYGLVQRQIKSHLPKKVKVIQQEELLPNKLKNYLVRHPEIKRKLSSNPNIDLRITKANTLYSKLAKQWFGKSAKLRIVKL